jgi:hypothetical protein
MRYQKVINVRVKDRVYKQMEDFCLDNEVTIGELVRAAVDLYLEKHNKKENVFN